MTAAPAVRRVYLDHAATTPVDPEVLAAMVPHFSERAGNPSSIHLEGRVARHALDAARESVADAFHADPSEIVFTGSGSEGANLAIKGAVLAGLPRGRNHVVTTAVEHHAVLHAVQHLARQYAVDVTTVPVDPDGRVTAQDVLAALRPDTALVSVMYANNEVGAIQPIAEIGAALRDHPALFHTDAVQAAGSLSLDVQALDVDLLSIAAHKVYGPKGVGALYIRRGVRLIPQVHGGTQERNRRAGTENVALVVGLAAALQKAQAQRAAAQAHNAALTQQLIDGVLAIPQTRLNGPREGRLANNTNFCIEGIEGESMLLELDAANIAASSGSACTSASVEPSHVLLAMGIPAHLARTSLRLTTGWANTLEDIDYTVATLTTVVARLRRLAHVAAGSGVG
ncbi:MAG: cysteine desulfurase [Actinobacteria bacterium]|nr:cysteine desulfurase [Actinomycetota bacterium]